MGLILDLLKSTVGEASFSDALGTWRQTISRAVEALVQAGGGGVPLGNAAPEPVGLTSHSGTSFYASREDHVHAHANLPGGTLHAIATETTNGFMSAADKLALDNLVIFGGGVPPTRTLFAGVGLSGGGDLSADRTFDIDPLVITIILNSVPQSTVLTAGAGLTGGGDLSANRTFDVGATNSTMIIDADGIRLATAIELGFAGESVAQSVSAEPGWNVIGGFVFAGSWTTAVLESMFLVSNGALTGRVRLFDLTAGIPVAGSTLSSSSTTEQTQTTADILAQLTVGNTYQFQAEAFGGVASSDMIVVREARLLVE